MDVSLTDSRHEGSSLGWAHETSRRIIVMCSAIIRVNRHVLPSIELQQVSEYLPSAKVLTRISRPLAIVDRLFTLVKQGLAHAQQLLPTHFVASVQNMARFVCDAGRLE